MSTKNGPNDEPIAISIAYSSISSFVSKSTFESVVRLSSARSFTRDADEQGLAILAFGLCVKAEAGVGITEEAVRIGAFGYGVHEGTEAGEQGAQSLVIRPRCYQCRSRIRKRCGCPLGSMRTED